MDKVISNTTPAKITNLFRIANPCYNLKIVITLFYPDTI